MPTTWLDITKPSSDQGDTFGPASVAQFSATPEAASNLTFGGAQVGLQVLFTNSLGFGEEISDSTLNFSAFAVHALATELNIYSLIPQGVERYIGVSFDDDDGAPHYGWIGVTRNGLDLVTFAWGYETKPITPISAGIPGPGALALLAIAALGGSRRRRTVPT